MSNDISRRQVLVGGGVGLAAVLAGCRTSRDLGSGPTTTTTTTAVPLPHRRPSPNPYLSGNFAPGRHRAHEDAAADHGTASRASCRGTLLRNGPNPISPDPATYHWFLGDGMVHAIDLDGGRASYRNRFVRTDDAAGLLHESVIGGQPPELAIGGNRAQTAIVSHAGRILALYEPSLPTEITTGAETIGRYDFGGALRSPMTAHPKIDPRTGEMLFFGLDLLGPTYLRFHVVDRSGKLVLSKDITLPRPVMMHDFAVTERHVVFLDLPVVYDLGPRRPAAVPREVDDPRPGRASGSCRGMRAPPRAGSTSNPATCSTPSTPTTRATRSCSTWCGTRRCSPTICYGWATGPGRSTAGRSTWGPVVSESNGSTIGRRSSHAWTGAVLGRRHRYAYAATSDLNDFIEPFGTLLQHDLRSGTTAAAKLGPGRQAGEGIFVPAGATAAEDEGWVLSVVYNAPEDRSDLVIIDATDFGGDPVATIALPQRVPFGFHGIWEPAPASSLTVSSAGEHGPGVVFDVAVPTLASRSGSAASTRARARARSPGWSRSTSRARPCGLGPGDEERRFHRLVERDRLRRTTGRLRRGRSRVWASIPR